MSENRNFSTPNVQEHWWQRRRAVEFLTNSRFKLKHSGVLIEGDSMVQHFENIISENAVKAVSPSQENEHHFGISSLHLCYLVNRFMSAYHAHDVPVTVIFFSNHENVISGGSGLLLRKVVLTILRNLARDYRITIRIFESFLSNDFCEYIQDKMTGFAPIELMVMTTKRTAVNSLYGTLLIDYWGIAVCDMDKLDLLGIVKVYDATSKSGQDDRNLEDMRARYPEEVEKIDAVFGQQDGDGTGLSTASLSLTPQPDPISGRPESSLLVDVDALKIVISLVAAQSSDVIIRAVAESHLAMIDIQTQLPLTERFFPGLEDRCDFLPSLGAYHDLFCAEILRHWTDVCPLSTAVSDSTQQQTVVLNGLFVGDLWDGRLLAAVHLFRTSPLRDFTPLLSSPERHEEEMHFSTIQCDLVDRIRAYAVEKFDISMPFALENIDSMAINQYGNTVMNHNKHTHTNEEITFYTPCKDVYFDSRNEGVEREMKDQKDMAEGEVTGHLISGGLHVDAIRNGKRTTPLGRPRVGWQDMCIPSLSPTMLSDVSVDTSSTDPSSEIILLPPKYNAVDISAELESELRDQYMLEEGFRPEPWQLRMLQSIEQDLSVLIVAPTSSGKTLAAEYAMRKVCRDNERNNKKNIAVFVQPTNALVDQTYGVFAVDPHVGKSKVAMYTAEVRTDNFTDNTYEVLVTNPQCLQILIMSGHTKGENSFYSRLRYVVFDEIHCIGQDIGTGSSNGVVWEQLLATVDCPIIGLSATLANTQAFYDWLVSIKTLQLQQKLVQLEGLCASESNVRARAEHTRNYKRVLRQSKEECTRLIIHTERSTPLHYYRNVLNDECTLFNRISLDFQTPIITETRLNYGYNVIKIAEKITASSSSPTSPHQSSSGVQIQRISGRLLRGLCNNAELWVEFVGFCGAKTAVVIRLVEGARCKEDRDMVHCSLSVTLRHSSHSAAGSEDHTESPEFLLRDYSDKERDEESFRDFSSWISFSLEITAPSDTTSPLCVTVKLSATEQWHAVGESTIHFSTSLGVNALQSVELGAPSLSWFADDAQPLDEVNSMLSQLTTLHKNTSSKFGESNYTVCLEKYDREVVTDSFNPLSFLAHIDHFSATQLSSFFEAVPHTKLGDLQILFTKLMDSEPLKAVSFSDNDDCAWSVVKEILRSHLQSGSELSIAYNELRVLFSRPEDDGTFSIHKQPVTVGECHLLAGFRLKFDEIVTRMHSAVLKVNSFEDRFLLDIVCAHAFHQSGLDWYGQQWLDGSMPLADSLLEFLDITISDLVRDSSPVTSSLQRLTACLYANYPEQQNKVGVYKDAEGVYPSSVSALNRAVFYYLHLLLVQTQDITLQSEGSVFCPVDTDTACVVIPRTVLSCLRDLSSKSYANDHAVETRFSSEKVATLLRNLLASETIAPNPKTRDVHNAVKQPTLIFHLSKSHLEKYVKELVEDSDMLSLWFVKSKVGVDGVTKYITGTEGCFLTPEDLEEIESLPNTSDAKKRALRYGIGMHVATVKENRKYRRLVEILFQQKKLKFVFCTTSLSFGINMPCSDVLFLGDSPHLTNMVFRQSSGRAGRRGYVNSAGNIYFVGFPLLSIHRKLCMPLDNLSPRQAVSPAYILKVTSISATCHDNNRSWVDNMTLRGLVNPLFERLLDDKHHVRGEFRSALMNSMRFTWGFLREKGYLNHEGKAQIKANIPYREHYMEPKCFLLAELFDAFLNPLSDPSSGYLGLVSGVCDTPKKEIRLDLKVFMSLIYFGSYSEMYQAEQGRTSEHRLEDCLSTAWSQYNQSVMQSFIRYIRSECKKMTAETFPLLEEIFFPSEITTLECGETVRRFVNWYRCQHPQQQTPCARSVFSSVSGRGDEFNTIEELLLSVRTGMIIDRTIIPSFDVHEFVNNTLPITFTSGRFNRDDHNAQSSCEDFSRNLRGLMASLEQMYASLQVRPKRDSKTQILMDSFKRVRDTFTMQLEKAKNFTTCKGIVHLVRTLKDGNVMGIVYFTVLEKGGARLKTAKFYKNNERTFADKSYQPVEFDCVEFTLRKGKHIQGMSRLGGLRERAVCESLKVKSVDTRALTGAVVTKAANSTKSAGPQSFHYLFESQTAPECGVAYSCLYSPLVNETHALMVDFNPYVRTSGGGGGGSGKWSGSGSYKK